MSSPMLRFPRLACSMLGFGSPSTRSGPVWRSPRWGSPVTACSTLMTSAPHSASTAPADGTNPYMATSRTWIPSSGLLMLQPSSLRASGSSATHHCRVGLALEELLESGLAHLAADARLLETAERAVGAEVVATVDRQRPGANPPGDGKCPFLAAEH